MLQRAVSGSSLVSKPIDVLPITEPQVVISAPLGQPACLQPQFLFRYAAWHEHDAVSFPTPKMLQVLTDLFCIEYRAYDELQLIISTGDQLLHNLRLIPAMVVIFDPFLSGVTHRR